MKELRRPDDSAADSNVATVADRPFVASRHRSVEAGEGGAIYCGHASNCAGCYPPPSPTVQKIKLDVGIASLIALLAVVVAIGYVVVRGRGDGPIGEWGIVTVLPWTYWVCLAVPALVFIRELCRRCNPWVLASALIGQTALIYGSTVGSETMPRFATAWVHAGFTNEILTSGQVTTGVDARFSWPGFFSSAGVFASAVGVAPVGLLKWVPLCIGLAYLLPLALLFRSLHTSARVRWTGLWIFSVLNWVGQDYFAPQSFAYLLHLISLSVVTAVFLGGTRVRFARWRLPAWVKPLAALLSERPPGADGRHSHRQLTFLVVALVAISMAIAMSHQLTPFMLGSTLALLGAAGMMRLKLLPVTIVMITFAWLCYGAEDYWIGHLDTIFGSAGQVTSVVNSGVGSRLRGSSVHQTVVNLRIASAASIWLLAGVGFLVAVRRRKQGLIIGMIAGAPFLMLAVQAYGGEGVLRIYLFSLPGTALLAAEAAVMLASTRRAMIAPATCIALLILPTSLVARYGNESYERVTPDEARAIAAVYDLAPIGSTLVSLSPNLTWRYGGLTQYNYAPSALDEFAIRRVDLIISMMANNPKGAYLVITNGQLVYGEQVYGLPVGWGATMQRDIAASRRFAIVYENADATIYKLRNPVPKRMKSSPKKLAGAK